jgi:HTH-type transcriptional regulator, bacterioopsin transcriptional activator and related proteins
MADSGALFWSEEIYTIHGLEPGCDVSMETAIDAYHPEDREQVREFVHRALESNENFQFVRRIIRPDGTIRHVRATGVVMLRADGEVRSVFGVFQDITEILLNERRLKERTEFLLEAERLGRMGHWIVYPKTGELFWSDEVYRIHGMEVGGEIDVDAAVEAYHPNDREMVVEHVRQALEEKQDYGFELRIIRSGGELRHVRSTGVVKLDDQGNVDSVFGVFQDVTER